MPLVGVSSSTDDFVREAAIGDMFETVSSELAAIRGNVPIRAFAARMNEAHQKSSAELTLLVRRHAAERRSHQRWMAAGRRCWRGCAALWATSSTGSTGGSANRHRDAISLFQRYAGNGDNPQLRLGTEPVAGAAGTSPDGGSARALTARRRRWICW